MEFMLQSSIIQFIYSFSVDFLKFIISLSLLCLFPEKQTNPFTKLSFSAVAIEVVV